MSINILTDNEGLLLAEYGSSYTLDRLFTWQDIKDKVIQVLLFQKAHKLAGPAWFLQVLFLTEIFYNGLEFIFKKIFRNKFQIYFDILLFIIFVFSAKFTLAGYMDSKYKINIVFLSMFLFHVGSKLKENDTYYSEYLNPMVICFISIAIIFIMNKLDIGTIRYVRGDIKSGIYLFICSLSGWYLLYGISILVSQVDSSVRNIIIYIGRNTLPIMLLHLLAFKIVTALQILIYSEPWYMLGAFSVLHGSNGWWLVYAIIGVVMPLIFTAVMKRIKALVNKNVGEIFIRKKYNKLKD